MGRPAWMRAMEANTSGWLRLLPPSITPLKRTVENIKDPLYRFFEREVNFGLKLLQAVRLDLEDVAAIIQSGKKQTNHHRALIQQLNKGIIPKSWLDSSLPSFVPPVHLSVPYLAHVPLDDPMGGGVWLS